MPERMTVGRTELGGEIDVATELEHPIVVALEYRVGLFGRKIIFLQILGLVRLEGFAVLVLHQRHAEHVDAVALTRAFGIENERARDVLVFVFGLFGLRLSHRRFSLVASVLRSEIPVFHTRRQRAWQRFVRLRRSGWRLSRRVLKHPIDSRAKASEEELT